MKLGMKNKNYQVLTAMAEVDNLSRVSGNIVNKLFRPLAAVNKTDPLCKNTTSGKFPAGQLCNTDYSRIFLLKNNSLSKHCTGEVCE